MTGAETASTEFGAIIAILCMAAATYLVRLGGFWLMGRVALTPTLRRMLEALPGSVVAATIVPIIYRTGTTGALAMALVLLLMAYTRNEFIAVFAGIAAAALARAVGL